MPCASMRLGATFANRVINPQQTLARLVTAVNVWATSMTVTIRGNVGPLRINSHEIEHATADLIADEKDKIENRQLSAREFNDKLAEAIWRKRDEIFPAGPEGAAQAISRSQIAAAVNSTGLGKFESFGAWLERWVQVVEFVPAAAPVASSAVARDQVVLTREGKE